MNRLILSPGFLLFVAAAFAFLAGCGTAGAHDASDELAAGTMLIDFYHSTTASSGGDGYSEMVLYTTTDNKILKLCVYSRPDKTSDEQHTEYMVPYNAASDCYSIIDRYSLEQWNTMEDAISTDGALTVCKYYNNGSYIRVSSEKMPENGEVILASIGSAIEKYIVVDICADIIQSEV